MKFKKTEFPQIKYLGPIALAEMTNKSSNKPLMSEAKKRDKRTVILSASISKTDNR